MLQTALLALALALGLGSFGSTAIPRLVPAAWLETLSPDSGNHADPNGREAPSPDAGNHFDPNGSEDPSLDAGGHYDPNG